MLPKELKYLKLIPASAVLDDPSTVPAAPGVYLFFLTGGHCLLEATAYYESGSGEPMRVGEQTHVYTGAALFKLRERVQTNLRADVTSSSFSRSLLAIERVTRAISRSGTPACRILGERSLARWLSQNATVGIEVTHDPLERERELLATYASPLNIAHRRNRLHSRTLSAWRCGVFPTGRPDCARRVRYR